MLTVDRRIAPIMEGDSGYASTSLPTTHSVLQRFSGSFYDILYFSVCWLNLGVQLLICIVHVNDKFFNFHFIWQIIFLTKVFHPNVEPDGKICIDFLQDEWKPSYTIGYRKCWMELFFNLLMHIIDNTCNLHM